jgi:hypothetical protein
MTADPLLDDPDVLVEIFSNESGCSARLVHTPSGTVATSPWARIGRIEAAEQAAAELRWSLSLPPESLDAMRRCICGSVRARLKGQESWARTDILCPVCDSFSVG